MDRIHRGVLVSALISICVVFTTTVEVSRAAFDDSSTTAGSSFATADCFARPSSVQNGSVTSTTNGTTSAGITTVDPTKAFLVFSTRTSGNRPVSSEIGGRINGAGTQVEFVRVTDESTPVSMIIEWYVVEYDRGVDVQRGESDLGTIPADVTITAVDLSRSFVTYSKTALAADSTYDGNDPASVRLTSTTNLQFDQSFGTSGHTAYWQVITFDDDDCAAVQRGTTSLTGTTTTVDVSLGTAVDLSTSFVLTSHHSSGGGSDVGSRLISARFLNSSTVRIQRSATGSPDDIDTIAWEVVELGDGSSVQSGSSSFSSSQSVRTASLSTVDLTQAWAFASSQGGSGQNGGRTAYTADDIPGEAFVTVELTATQITLTRASTNSTADIDWFVVHW